jgi:hypothetical protein
MLETLAAETQRLETIYRQKIAALNELKQSILQKAFTGELTADTTKSYILRCYLGECRGFLLRTTLVVQARTSFTQYSEANANAFDN